MADSTATAFEHDGEPHFSWDIDISNEPFWTDLGPCSSKVARAFLACCNKSSLAGVKLNIGDTAPPKTKLTILRDVIEDRHLVESAQVAPSHLRDVDYPRWRSFQAGLATMEHYLGNFRRAEDMGRAMCEHGPDGNGDMSALHAQSSLWQDMGKYEQAEAAARLVLPWLQAHPVLGDKNSPQALGSMKILAKSLWKQGRYAEAEYWFHECDSLIREIANGKFKKYEEDERQQWVEHLRTLRGWHESPV